MTDREIIQRTKRQATADKTLLRAMLRDMGVEYHRAEILIQRALESSETPARDQIVEAA